jgi:hypothetical protein
MARWILVFTHISWRIADASGLGMYVSLADIYEIRKLQGWTKVTGIQIISSKLK